MLRTLRESLLELINVWKWFVFIVASVVHHFEFFSGLDIFLEFSLGCGVDSILEVDHIQDISPGAFVAINALGRAVACSTHALWQALGFESIDQNLRRWLSCN